jgi:hypothetical protein
VAAAAEARLDLDTADSFRVDGDGAEPQPERMDLELTDRAAALLGEPAVAHGTAVAARLDLLRVPQARFDGQVDQPHDPDASLRRRRRGAPFVAQYRAPGPRLPPAVSAATCLDDASARAADRGG